MGSDSHFAGACRIVAVSKSQSDPRLPAILLMGPTASGKSALALALAERFPVEIVSVDSAQVYRGMDIGTAKPDAATRARIPHHLVDLIEPTDAYSAARFRADALAAVAAIRARGRLPLLVGGTMLYFKALHEGLSALPPADPTLRAVLDARAAAEGWPALHAELARVDPVTAARLAPQDAQRIQRALEVHALTGTPLSALQGARASDDALGAHVAFALLPPDRAQLHATIAERFDAMLAAGLVAELARAPGAPSAAARAAGDALRRLPPGVAVPRRGDRRRRTARDRHRGHPPARQAPVHLAAHVAGRTLRPRRGRTSSRHCRRASMPRCRARAESLLGSAVR